MVLVTALWLKIIIYNTTIPSGNTNNKGITDQNGVISSLNGPKYSVQGKTLKLIWKITNNGSEPIQNVQALDQSNSHNFGNIAWRIKNIHNFSKYSYFGST